MRRLVSLLMVLLMVCSVFFSAAAEPTLQPPLRVAVLQYPSYSALNEDGKPVGLAMDYLATLAQYTGWTYEYVPVTLENAQEKLISGEIDLIPGRSKSFSEQALYATKSMGSGLCVLVCREDDARYAYQDYASFTGMRVGVLRGSNYVEDVRLAESSMGFQLNTVFYDTHEECMAALHSGEVDALLMLNIRREKGTKDIARFGSTDLYMAVTPTRPDLLDILNEANEQLYIDAPFHMLTLWEKYYSDTLVSLNLTRAEMDYMAVLPPLRVGLLNDLPVYAYLDETGTPCGILPDLLALIAQKLGVELEIHTSGSINLLLGDLRAGKYDLVLPLHSTEDVTYASDVQLLPLIDATLQMAGPSDTQISSLTGITISTGSSSPVFRQIISESLSSKVNVLHTTDSLEEALNCILRKESSVAVCTGLALQKLLEKPLYSSLSIYPVYDTPVSLTIGLRSDASPLLASSLKKTIATLTSHDTETSIIRHTVGSPYRMTIGDMLYLYRRQVTLLLVLFVLLTVLTVVIVHIMRNNRRRIAASRTALEQEIEQRHQLEAQRELDQRHHEELRFLATHDTQTGLFNIHGFEQATRRLLDEHPDVNFKMVRLDINSFKIYNDLFGSDAGQKVIKSIANQFVHLADDMMTYAHLSNDHFVCCMPDAIDTELLLREVTVWMREQTNGYELVPCMGEYRITNREQSVPIMCDRAMAALQTVKGLYPPRLGRYTKELRETLLNDQWITANMRQALLNGEFIPYFQPQYRLYTGQITGAEVLVRWRSKEKGFITPNQFIPIFEKNGFITEMDTYIWEESCKWLRRWLDAGNPPIALSINASRLDVRNLNLPQVLPELVARYKLPPSLVRLEITESAYTQDPEQFIHTIRALQQTGFTIEMDDFGSGYSSLNLLKDIPVDVLKLDMLFLSAGDEFGRSASIIRSVVNMSKSLNLSVIAEGVETVQQSDFLKSIGCTHAQGYRYSKPVSMEEFEELLHQSNIAIADERSTATAPAQPDRSLLTGTRQLILLVTQDEERCAQLRQILGDEYDYIEASTGPMALTLLQTGLTPDCILLDTEMPGSEGYELLRRLRSIPEAQKMLILVLTPISQGESAAHEAIVNGASDILYMPFFPEVVQHRVRNQLMLQQAIQQAQTDGLTGLLNRTAFRHLTDATLKASEGSAVQGVFMTLDLDSFKLLNDQYGHAFGDRVLTAFADMLTTICGDQAIISRLGGDEFGILVPNVASREEMQDLSRRIVQQTKNLVIDGHGGLVSCSLGASVYPADAVLRLDLYSAADQALYAAKRKDGDHFMFFDELPK